MKKEFEETLSTLTSTYGNKRKTEYFVMGKNINIAKMIGLLAFSFVFISLMEIMISEYTNEFKFGIRHILVVIAFILIILQNYYLKHALIPKTTNINLYSRYLPSKLKPAHVRFLVYDGKIDELSIASTLLDLMDRDYIKICAKKNNNNNINSKDVFEYNYDIIKKTGKDINELEKFEKYLIHWFIDGYGNGEEVSKEQLLDGLLKSKKHPACEFRNWQEYLIKSFPNEKYYSFIKNKKIYYVKNMIYLCGIILSMFPILPISLAPLGIYSLGCILFANPVNILTIEGVNEIDNWRKLKKYLKHFSNIKDKNIEEIEIWNYYLTYSVCLGIKSKASEQIVDFYKDNIYLA